MLVRRLIDAPTEGFHRLSLRLLMDAGAMGSRNLSITWIEVPPGVEQPLLSHDQAEQAYLVIGGSGRMEVAGDVETLSQGDLVLVPPSTDHLIANDGDEPFVCASIQSPPVSFDELYREEELAAGAAGYDFDED